MNDDNALACGAGCSPSGVLPDEKGPSFAIGMRHTF
jgi:hypothetical protein